MKLQTPLSLIVFFLAANIFAAIAHVQVDPEIKKNDYNFKNHTPYKGASGDDEAFKRYIQESLIKIYGLSTNDLIEPSLATLVKIRDFTHQMNAIYKKRLQPDLQCLLQNADCMFTKKGGGTCGFVSLSLFNIYSILGYPARRYDVVDGSLKTMKAHNHFDYRDSHAFVEVYLPSLKKFVLQDPTYNHFWNHCESKEPLSYFELQQLLYKKDEIPCLVSGPMNHKNYPKGQVSNRLYINLLDDYLGFIVSIYFTQNGKRLHYSSRDLARFKYKKLFPDKESLQIASRGCGCKKSKMTQCLKCLNNKGDAIGIEGLNTFGIQAQVGKNIYFFTPRDSKFYSGRFDRLWYKNVSWGAHLRFQEHWINRFSNIHSIYIPGKELIKSPVSNY